MAVTVKATNLQVSNNVGDMYTISADVQLMDGTTVLAARTLSVTTDRYAANDIKARVKAEFQAEIAEWKQQLVKAAQMKTLLATLAGEL